MHCICICKKVKLIRPINTNEREKMKKRINAECILIYWDQNKARLQQYVNQELPDVQTGFRKGRGTGDQIVNIHWIMEKVREFQKNIYFCFLTMPKPLTVRITANCLNSARDGNTRPPDLTPEKSVCRSRRDSLNWTWNNWKE